MTLRNPYTDPLLADAWNVGYAAGEQEAAERLKTLAAELRVAIEQRNEWAERVMVLREAAEAGRQTQKVASGNSD